jgi:hypothetical protein
MRNLTDFAISQDYERIKELGDKLVEIGNRINWENFRPKLDVLLNNFYSITIPSVADVRTSM